MTCAIEHSALMPLCSTVCSWMCVYVHLYKQRVCKGARACGEKAGVPEASQTAADWEGADRLPWSGSAKQVSLSSEQNLTCNSSTEPIFKFRDVHGVFQDLHLRMIYIATTRRPRSVPYRVFCPLVLFLPWQLSHSLFRISSRPRWEPMYLCLSVLLSTSSLHGNHIAFHSLHQLVHNPQSSMSCL